MRPELERLQQIEQHLLTTTSSETRAWDVQLLLDPELRTDAEMQRHLYQGIHLAGQRQLRRELATIHQRLYGAARVGWLHTATAGLHTLLMRRLRGRADG